MDSVGPALDRINKFYFWRPAARRLEAAEEALDKLSLEPAYQSTVEAIRATTQGLPKSKQVEVARRALTHLGQHSAEMAGAGAVPLAGLVLASLPEKRWWQRAETARAQREQVSLGGFAHVAACTGDGLARLWQPLGLKGLEALACKPADARELAAAAAGNNWLPGLEQESRLVVLSELAAGDKTGGLLGKMAPDLSANQLVLGLQGLAETSGVWTMAHNVLRDDQDPARWDKLGRHLELPAAWSRWVGLGSDAKERGSLTLGAVHQLAAGSESRAEATAVAVDRVHPGETTSRQLLAALPELEGYRQALKPGILQALVGDRAPAGEQLLGGLLVHAAPGSEAAAVARNLKHSGVIEKALEAGSQGVDGARNAYLKALLLAARAGGDWSRALEASTRPVPDSVSGMISELRGILPAGEDQTRALKGIMGHLAVAAHTPEDRESLKVLGCVMEHRPTWLDWAMSSGYDSSSGVARMACKMLATEGSDSPSYPFFPGDHKLARQMIGHVKGLATLEKDQPRADLAQFLLDLDRERATGVGQFLTAPVKSVQSVLGVDTFLAHGLAALSGGQVDSVGLAQSIVRAYSNSGEGIPANLALLFARTVGPSAPPAVAAQITLIPSLVKLSRGYDLAGQAIGHLDRNATDPVAAQAGIAIQACNTLYREERPQAAERLTTQVMAPYPFLQQLSRAPLMAPDQRQALQLGLLRNVSDSNPVEPDPGWLAMVAFGSLQQLDEKSLAELAPTVLDGLVAAAAKAHETTVFPKKVEDARTALAAGEPVGKVLKATLLDLGSYEGDKFQLLVTAQEAVKGAKVESIGETESAVLIGGVRVKKR